MDKNFIMYLTGTRIAMFLKHLKNTHNLMGNSKSLVVPNEKMFDNETKTIAVISVQSNQNQIDVLKDYCKRHNHEFIHIKT